MAIKLKFKDNDKKIVTVRDEVQAAAFEKAGFVPVNKEEAAKLAELKGEKVEEVQE
jgi:hypothetical protein